MKGDNIMSEEKNIKMEENNQEVTEMTEVKGSKIKTIGTKVVGGVKKHGKKLALGIGAVAVGVVAAKLLGGKGCDGDYDCDHDCENCGSADGYLETDAE